jgi:hypothetical protein
VRVVFEVEQAVEIPRQIISMGNDLFDQIDGLSVTLSP